MTKTDTLALAAAPRAWYRERWPWLLAAGPLVVIVAGFATLWIAWSTHDGVVADDYYKRGIVINKDLERAGRAAALGVAAVVAVDADGRVRVELSGISDPPPALRATFTNATRAGLDRSAALAREADGTYVGRIEPPPAGRWLVSVETASWRLPAVETGTVIGRVRVGPPSAPN